MTEQLIPMGQAFLLTSIILDVVESRMKIASGALLNSPLSREPNWLIFFERDL